MWGTNCTPLDRMCFADFFLESHKFGSSHSLLFAFVENFDKSICLGLLFFATAVVPCITFSSTFIYIILIFTLSAAKYRVRSGRKEHLAAMLADFQRRFFIRQHKTKHHLYCQQERMKIPYNGRLFKVLYQPFGCFTVFIVSNLISKSIFHILPICFHYLLIIK